jgi:hypothetical protein
LSPFTYTKGKRLKSALYFKVGNIMVDTNISPAELPPGTKATGISAFGASFWTRTARLDTEKDDQSKPYFLKVKWTAYSNLHPGD